MKSGRSFFLHNSLRSLISAENILEFFLKAETEMKKQEVKRTKPTMRPQEHLGHGKNWANSIHKRNFGHFSL